jgi:hypothetical protein
MRDLLLLAVIATASPCDHEFYPQVVQADGPPLADGQVIFRPIDRNTSHLYYYENYNVTTMNQPDRYRKLIFDLEPCDGVVYLLVRKTRPCWPNPYSCIKLTENAEERKRTCEWTHFMSEVDGSLDGAPTFYEVPLSATKYFITVFAYSKASYRLTLLADIGAMPRPGLNGRLEARQNDELEVLLTWHPAHFSPIGVSQVKQYHVYSSMLLSKDKRSNTNVFLRPSKILNTVCGLTNNADRPYSYVTPDTCENDVCTANIRGVMTNKWYALNVIVESERGFTMAYGGLVIQTNWKVVTQYGTDQALRVVGAVSGSVLGIVIIGYIWLLKLYN